jgi:hypothetical protein
MILTKNSTDSIYSTCFDDTTARTGAWNMITITENATFTLLTDANRDGSAVTGITFPAGITIYGNFTAITLAGGSCIAYKR